MTPLRQFQFTPLLSLAVLVLSLIIVPRSLWAGKGPSVVTCKEAAWLDVTCIVCSTGEKFGMVSVEAEYDPIYNDCGKNYSEARTKCASFYGKDRNMTGVKWEQYIGGTIYKGWAPKNCKH